MKLIIYVLIGLFIGLYFFITKDIDTDTLSIYQYMQPLNYENI